MKLLVILALSAVCVLATPIAEPEPTFDAFRDIRLLLSTRRNRGQPFQLTFRDLGSINASPFDPAKPLRVLIHGWWEDETSDISTETSEELLNYYDNNVLFIDWSEGSRTINYIGASNRVEPVGEYVAMQLNWMRQNGLIDFDRTFVIGFSLGAHAAGFAGKHTGGQLFSIVGLDPAGPLFSERRPEGRINFSDARHVECLHTNGGLVGAGIGAAICDADFFPNGGSSQRGCLTNTCSHLRAVTIFVESIQNNGFHSIRCTSELQASRENCNSGGGQWFAHVDNAQTNLRGIFSFSTNRNEPLAEGPWRN